jgi:NAD(P)H dehydrogenase (quinone)
MKVLIVYAHPESKGFCYNILKDIREYLRDKKINYGLIDLYKIKYNPVLDEKGLYERKLSKIDIKIQDKIKKANYLIFIYPIWWEGMPAILKGFFDRVLTSGFAFKYVNKVPVGLLKGKRAVVFMTRGGRKSYKIFTGERAAKNIKYDILRFCGIKSKVFQVYHATKLTDERLKEMKRIVKEGMAWLGI